MYKRQGNTLLIDLEEERTITSFHYLPDQSEYNKGLIAAYEISVGTDSNAVNQVVAKDEFSNIKSNPICLLYTSNRPQDLL